MKKSTVYILLSLLLIVALCVIPFALHTDSEFGGADGMASEIVEEIDPGYEPWYENFWSPPGSETESLLFALQAALGSGIFCFCIGYLAGQKKKDSKEDKITNTKEALEAN